MTQQSEISRERPVLNSRQIALLRDIRMMDIMAFFDSPFRLEGPELREMGLIDGIGDSTGVSAAGLAALKEADAKLKKQILAQGTSHD